MVTVAIAGGGSAIASNIINAILATKKHQLVILSRSPRPELEAQGAIVKVVDYDSHEQLTNALRGVHTVLSCIWTYGPTVGTLQIALLEAAKEAKAKEPVWEAVKKSGLEYTRFINGLWMNVWAPGAPRDEEVARAGYKGPAFLLDINSGSITIPGDGNGIISVTDMRDVGKYAAAALDFEKWDEDSVIVGDKVTINELVEKIEKITGKKLDKSYVSLDAIDAVIAGEYDLTPNVNERVPEVKPLKVDEFLATHWTA
ncbi:nmrA-like family domain-containing protein [Trichoderma breve]|uniref:NmrA-like family domain-containing protein n=1 Tax=Trichoderma breve TaxID=2034170 RepID=A0A9W9E8Y8_9HYPO|nr:nmrA-like family domain-containing protein [Trichoderma breve]KAJ4862519.1 nmrA-like family domain-containing protein [Trichoderma breve]